eukprot:383399_1
MLMHQLHLCDPDNHDYAKFDSMPLYIKNLIHDTFLNIIQIRLGVYKSKDNCYYRTLFDIVFKDDSGWIKIDVITALFPQLQTITLGNAQIGIYDESNNKYL